MYASMGKKQPLAMIKVRVDGEEQVWSAGRNEQGLLGQGAGVRVSKTFKPVKYDHKKLWFKQVSVHTDHAMAIDANSGEIYAWGCNVAKRAGFKDDLFDGVFEPKLLAFPAKEHLTAVSLSCGFDHTLVLFEDTQSRTQKLFSIG